jgi:hypothetical protein
VQITSYNLHLGLLRSEHCWGEHRTVYSGRREADVVMTSIRTCQNGCAFASRSFRNLRPISMSGGYTPCVLPSNEDADSAAKIVCRAGWFSYANQFSNALSKIAEPPQSADGAQC